MKQFLVSFCFLSLVSLPAPLQAQQRALLEPAYSPPATELTLEAARVATQREAAHLRTKTGDYRYEGLAIGAALLGTVGVLLGQICGPQPLDSGSGCGDTGNSIGLGLLGAAVGGGLGYLVGWTAPKYSAAPRDSVEAQ